MKPSQPKHSTSTDEGLSPKRVCPSCVVVQKGSLAYSPPTHIGVVKLFVCQYLKRFYSCNLPHPLRCQTFVYFISGLLLSRQCAVELKAQRPPIRRAPQQLRRQWLEAQCTGHSAASHSLTLTNRLPTGWLNYKPCSVFAITINPMNSDRLLIDPRQI